MDDEAVLRMLDGELSGMEWEAVEQHLDGCEPCRTLVAALCRPRTSGEVGPRTTGSLRRVVSDQGEGFSPLEEIPGRYLVEAVQGQGGQARVLLVFDRLLQREVALKEMLPPPDEPRLPRDPDPPSAVLGPREARFLREARTTGRLQHPTIIDVYEVGRRVDGTLYYTMPFLRGRTLAEALARCQRISDRLALLPHFVDVCNGVAYAHSQGVLHRDLKPANIMLGAFGESVILDWGLAKPLSEADADLRPSGPAPASAPGPGGVAGAAEAHPDGRWSEGSLGLSGAAETQAGASVGTPAYMSPEQAAGRLDEVDQRSDVWGLGAVLYELLTGHPPYTGTTAEATVREVLLRPVPPVKQRAPEAPAELAAVAEKALRKRKTDRYSGAKEIADEVEAFLTGRQVRAHSYHTLELLRLLLSRHRFVAGVVAAAAAVVFHALFFNSLARQRERLNRQVRASARAADARAPSSPRDAGDARSELALSPDGRVLAIIDRHGGLTTYDLHRGHRSRVLRGGRLGIRHLAFRRDGAQLALARRDGTLQLVEATSGRVRTTLPGFHPETTTLEYSTSGGVLYAGREDGRIELWTTTLPIRLGYLDGHRHPVTQIRALTDGRGLVSADRSGRLIIWDLEHRRPRVEFDSEAAATGLTGSPEARRLAAASEIGVRVRRIDQRRVQDDAARLRHQALSRRDGSADAPMGAAP